VLADYWKRGEQRPILFLKQPERMSLLLMGQDTQHTLGRWRWPEPVARLMRGERPGDVELVRLDAPRWFSDSGIATSQEDTAVIDLARAPHRLYVRPTARRRVFFASGSLVDASSADVALRVDGEPSAHWTVEKHFTLRALLEPQPSRARYIPTLIEAPVPMVISDIWVGPADEPVIRPARGFYFAERERDATLFRWIGPEAHATVYLPGSRAQLTIRGRVPRRFYAGPFMISLEWEGRPLGTFSIEDRYFTVQHDLVRTGGDPWQDLSIRASQAFVPKRLLGNGDSRQLSVQILEMTLRSLDSATAASGPRSALPAS
jgi:hypothetical protein